jgi:hypothetical protein
MILLTRTPRLAPYWDLRVSHAVYDGKTSRRYFTYISIQADPKPFDVPRSSRLLYQRGDEEFAVPQIRTHKEELVQLQHAVYRKKDPTRSYGFHTLYMTVRPQGDTSRTSLYRLIPNRLTCPGEWDRSAAQASGEKGLQ